MIYSRHELERVVKSKLKPHLFMAQYSLALNV